MNEQKYIIIKKASYTKDYQINIEFSDGKKQLVDFYPFLSTNHHPETEKYLQLENFKKFSIVEGDLMWGDYEMIFPIIDLYMNLIVKSASSKVTQAS